MSNSLVYYANGIGNLIMFTPALQSLASMDKTNKIDIMLPDEWESGRKECCKEILEGCDFVGRVIGSKIDKDYTTYFYTTHVEKYDPISIFKEKGKLYYTNNKWKFQGIHEIDYYMRHVRNLGYKDTTPKQYVPTKEFNTGFDKSKITIGVCNGRFQTRQWDKKEWPHFPELVNVLKHWFDCQVVGIGGDKKELTGVNLDIDFCGNKSILETAYAIKHLDVLITTDTGNMHMADALETPLIALFGGTLRAKNKPVSPFSHTLVSGVSCQPCQKVGDFGTCSDYVCMKKLSAGQVMDKVRRVLC